MGSFALDLAVGAASPAMFAIVQALNLAPTTVKTTLDVTSAGDAPRAIRKVERQARAEAQREVDALALEERELYPSPGRSPSSAA